MIDSVLKGTGNSRFLKSAVPAGTSWADALAMLQAGTFPIDFNGINTEGFQQVGTPLNKANLLKDATAAQIGLPPSTTPDGMFQALGNTGELHVWRMTEKVGSKGYYLDSVSSGRLSFVKNGASVVTFSYSDTVSPNGALSGTVNTVSLSGTGDQTSKLSVLRGKFCRAESSGGSDSAFSGIIYIPNDATFTYKMEGLDYHSHYVDKKQTVVFTDAPTTTTYPVSTNPNAYQEGDDAKPAGYTLGEVKTGQFSLGVTVDSSAINRYNYSSAIAANDDGTISLLNSSPIEINGGNSAYNNEAMAKIIGKYISLERVGDSNHPPDFDAGVVWFIPADATYGNKGSYPNNINYVTKRQPVTGYAAIPAGTTIEYLGKLGDKARVQVVSYVGTGTYGRDNKNHLTFSGKPRFVMVPGEPFGYAYIPNGNFYYAITGDYITLEDLYCDWNDDTNTMTWYHPRYPYRQYNESGRKYTFVAIY